MDEGSDFWAGLFGMGRMPVCRDGQGERVHQTASRKEVNRGLYVQRPPSSSPQPHGVDSVLIATFQMRRLRLRAIK